jgi:hypothetical protein
LLIAASFSGAAMATDADVDAGTATDKAVSPHGVARAVSTPYLLSTSGVWFVAPVDLRTPGRLLEMTSPDASDVMRYRKLIFPAQVVETDVGQQIYVRRGSQNEDFEREITIIDGSGCILVYSGTDWALKTSELGSVFRRRCIIDGLQIELTNANAKGGIRAFNVSGSQISNNRVYPAADVVSNAIGIFMDAFGDRLGENSQGGCNHNRIVGNTVGRILDPWNEDDTVDELGTIENGIVFAGSRAVRATCGQNATFCNNLLNFRNTGVAFTGCAPDPAGVDPANVQRFTPTYDYRIAEGAVGNKMYADRFVCQRTINSCRLTDKETYRTDLQRPPVAVLYDARNGLTLHGAHIEKCGIPVLVTHGADRELCMPGGNHITNCGFVQNDGTIGGSEGSTVNIRTPVLEAYPSAAYDGDPPPDHPTLGAYSFTTFMDPTDITNYISGDEYLSTIDSQSLGWADLVRAGNEDRYTHDKPDDGGIWEELRASLTGNENLSTIGTARDLLIWFRDNTTGTSFSDAFFRARQVDDTIRQDNSQRILPLVDYDYLNVGSG